ncbi:hypothetical protein BS78_05G107200 [Paspalum vaginatum]|nr:hypothetical protein BS78_05G107200 [Paspalum vaginatum]KAJ1275063.1 hypothetical protein BS78_05G107200 [Paspalum vaginatum]
MAGRAGLVPDLRRTGYLRRSILPPERSPEAEGTAGWKRDARGLFDGMHTGFQEDEAASKKARCEEDQISALPDEVIRHLLGFLPAPEAVRTSLLARGWRHHWKYMRSLRLTEPVRGTPAAVVVARFYMACQMPRIWS